MSSTTHERVTRLTLPPEIAPSLDLSLDPQLDTALDPQLDTALDPQLDTALDPQLDTALDPQLDTALDPSTFHHECLIDELARAAWRDPVQYRRERLPAASRQRRVLDEAARLSGWSRVLPAGRARGVALSTTLGAVAAHVVEVSQDDAGRSQVHRVVAVFDCGESVPSAAVRDEIEAGLRAWLGDDAAAALQLRFLCGGTPAGPAAFHPPVDASAFIGAHEALAPALANAQAVLAGQGLVRGRPA